MGIGNLYDAWCLGMGGHIEMIPLLLGRNGWVFEQAGDTELHVHCETNDY